MSTINVPVVVTMTQRTTTTLIERTTLSEVAGMHDQLGIPRPRQGE